MMSRSKVTFPGLLSIFPKILPLRAMTQFLKLLVFEGLAENPHGASHLPSSVVLLKCLCGK